MNFEKLLDETEAGKEIREMEEFYNAVDSDLSSFDSKMGIHCKCDSGTCCEHFVPDLTPLEAQYLAYLIIKDEKDKEVLARLSSADIDSGICPLYNKEGNYHCSLYSGRGLLCRLFGAACFVDKKGKGIFHPCKWNQEKKTLGEKELEGKNIPVMGEYGRALGTIEGNDERSELIYTALPKAIEKLKLILSFIDIEETEKL